MLEEEIDIQASEFSGRSLIFWLERGGIDSRCSFSGISRGEGESRVEAALLSAAFSSSLLSSLIPSPPALDAD